MPTPQQLLKENLLALKKNITVFPTGVTAQIDDLLQKLENISAPIELNVVKDFANEYRMTMRGIINAITSRVIIIPQEQITQIKKASLEDLKSIASLQKEAEQSTSTEQQSHDIYTQYSFANKAPDQHIINKVGHLLKAQMWTALKTYLEQSSHHDVSEQISIFTEKLSAALEDYKVTGNKMLLQKACEDAFNEQKLQTAVNTQKHSKIFKWLSDVKEMTINSLMPSPSSTANQGFFARPTNTAQELSKLELEITNVLKNLQSDATSRAN